ncbi:receptor like 42-like [Olea europaea subsp. europaea]|uniref:Receptor like 42-like n=1 Tax=Olea europaea subsp. europaea TaxID=158383 RepID=A0A8S0TEH7_OLEEU|nr:receptor like 42-like [Olea europaea subsp. europaea]
MIQVDSEFDMAFLLQYRGGFESAFVTWKGKDAKYIKTLNLVKLIDLSSNNLVGDVLVEITSLVTNHFSGGIPTGVSQLDQLGVLDLSYNNLSGKIPQSIHLRTFNASAFEENHGLCGLPLTKVCPEDEIVQVPKISYKVDGMKNQDVDKLIDDGIYISMAVGFVFGFWGVPHLNPPIPISLGNMSSLTSLYLYGNQLTGKVPCPALSSSLTDLDLFGNIFNATITQCIGSLSKLEYLYLGSNNFEDIITESCFSNLSQLQELYLSSNPGISFNIMLGWNLPFQLTHVSLADCKVGPHFPTWLRTQTRLEDLDISNAEISGTFPDCFWESSPKLWILNVSHNNFLGVLPDLSLKFSIFDSIDLSFNHFNGSLPILPLNGSWTTKWVHINTLNLVKLIDLSSNNLVGDVPDEITSLVMVVGLNFSINNLSGFLPTNIERLRTLDFLDFSRNHFSGGIPSGVSQVDQPGVLDLSYNNFAGEISQSIHLQTFNASAFERNLVLCGLPLTKACSGDEISQIPKTNDNANGMKTPEDEDNLINDGFYISMAIGFIFGFGECVEL